MLKYLNRLLIEYGNHLKQAKTNSKGVYDPLSS